MFCMKAFVITNPIRTNHTEGEGLIMGNMNKNQIFISSDQNP